MIPPMVGPSPTDGPAIYESGDEGVEDAGGRDELSALTRTVRRAGCGAWFRLDFAWIARWYN
ncbi:MAG: hypothetical protein OXH14_11100 [Alphaproteobacteria bacterium]|nr:hypothetical protein [Alphaproteobacteria bacterium]